MSQNDKKEEHIMLIHHLTDRITVCDHEPETDRPMLGLIQGDEKTLLVDSGISPYHVREFLDLVGSPAIDLLFLTHWHWDHIFGSPETGATELFCSQSTATILEELAMRDWSDWGIEEAVKEGFLPRFGADCLLSELRGVKERKIRRADWTFGPEEKVKIDLGGLTCEVRQVGFPHTEDSSILHIPSQKTLFLGDAVCGRRINGIYGYEPSELEHIIEVIESYDVTHCLYSHEKILTKEELLEDLYVIRRCKLVTDGTRSLEEARKLYVATGEPLTEEAEYFLSSFCQINASRENI